jgi:hypothetical protein
MARRVKLGPLARIGQQIIMSAVHAFGSGKITGKIPAIQVSVDDIL